MTWQRFQSGRSRQTCDHCGRVTESPRACGWLFRDLGGDVIRALCMYCVRQQARYQAPARLRADR